jgi:hypothetical protein
MTGAGPKAIAQTAIVSRIDAERDIGSKAHRVADRQPAHPRSKASAEAIQSTAPFVWMAPPLVKT